MAPGQDKEPAMDPYVLLVIRTTAKETVEEHQRRCGAYREFFGNGTESNPGMKRIVDRHETRIRTLENCKKSLVQDARRILVSVAATLLSMGLMLWMGWKVIEAKASELSDTRPPAKQVESKVIETNGSSGG